MSDPLRVISRIRNNRLMEVREQLGLSTRQFAERAGVGYQHYNSIENLSKVPSSAVADKIAFAANTPAEILFPAYLGAIQVTRVERTISEEAVLSLQDAERLKLPAGEYLHDENVHAREAIEQAIETLKPRYRQVIRMRFGLDGDGPGASLAEIGEQLGIGVARVQQIENSALRRLRHPKRSLRLRRLFGVGGTSKKA